MTDAVSHARDFAIMAHGDQRYDAHPYVFHLDAVAELLAPYGEQAMIVGYLHDVLEDTPVSFDTLAAEFGPLVATCVAYVTDPPGKNRAERKQAVHAKLATITGENELALIVKAADRLANIRMSQAADQQRYLAMYRNEHPAFRTAAYRVGLCEPLWAEIDQLLQ